jgi:hypothetical protein
MYPPLKSYKRLGQEYDCNTTNEPTLIKDHLTKTHLASIQVHSEVK